MAIDQATKKALGLGEQQAKQVLEFRNKALKRRTNVLRAQSKRGVRAQVVQIDPWLVRAVGGRSISGVLVAEGDSWFDYPWEDVLELLEDNYGYDVEAVAHKGDRVEHMAYSGGNLKDLRARSRRSYGRATFQKRFYLRRRQ